MSTSSSQTALITGASSGIGLHLAKEFAKHGHPLVLVAPNPTELADVAADIRSEHHVEVVTIDRDLREESAAQEIFDQLGKREIAILANNAGHGQKGNAWDIPLEEDISMISLNVMAVVRVTKLFLPPMLARGAGKILNTASVAGFEPGPGYTVYSSTKAFVLSYSEGLATELKETGISVTALCPGPTDTDFFPKADMLQTRAFQQTKLMAPQEVAEAAYKGLMAGERVIVPGLANKALVFMRRLIPESLQAKLNELLTEDVPKEQQKRERGDKEFDR